MTGRASQPPAGATESARPLTSVGIDIGSATTQVMVSRLWLDAAGGLVTNRLEVVYREVLHASDLRLTPFLDGRVIDADAVAAMVAQEYADAGIRPAQVETGALIVTGDASRKANAAAVAEAVAGMAGSFVCVAAGPHLEARLAARGSGALEVSAASDPSAVMLHVDIGGATTKLAVLAAGRIVETAAANVGARMLTFEDTGDGPRITSATPALLRLAAAKGIDVRVGQTADPGLRARLARILAADLLGFVRGEPRPVDDVMDEPVTAPLRHRGPFTMLSYSGGVAAYVNGDESRVFGDLGPELAEAVVDELGALGARTTPVSRSIRATVVGASQFSTQVSGTTTHHSDATLLPVRGLRAVPMTVPPGSFTPAEIEGLIRQAHVQVDLRPGEARTIVSVRWQGEPSFARLSAFAHGFDAAMHAGSHTAHDAGPAGGEVLVVALDGDLGGAVGSLLERRMPGRPLVCIDEVALGELDVVDVGAPVSSPPVLPVTIRSVQAI